MLGGGGRWALPAGVQLRDGPEQWRSASDGDPQENGKGRFEPTAATDMRQEAGARPGSGAGHRAPHLHFNVFPFPLNLY